jgi:hypothetical protein
MSIPTYHYVAVNGFMGRSNCLVYGLTPAEVRALSKTYPGNGYYTEGKIAFNVLNSTVACRHVARQ